MSIERCGHSACEEFLSRAEYCPQTIAEDNDTIVGVTETIDGMLIDHDLISDESHFRHDGLHSTGAREFSFMQAPGQGPSLRRTVRIGFVTKSDPKRCSYEIVDGWSIYGGPDGIVQAETAYSIDVHPAGLVRASLEYLCNLPETEPDERLVTEFDCAAMLDSLKDVMKYCARPPANQDSNLT